MRTKQKYIRPLVCLIAAQQLTGCEAVTSVVSQHPYGAAAIGAAAIVGGVFIAHHELDASRRHKHLRDETSYHLDRFNAASAEIERLKSELADLQSNTEQCLSDIQSIEAKRKQSLLTLDEYQNELIDLKSRRDELMHQLSALKTDNANLLASIKIDDIANSAPYSEPTNGAALVDEMYNALNSSVLP